MATKDIGQLRTRLSFEDEGNSQGLEGLRRDLRGLRSEMNLARSGGREYSNSLKGMREQSDILSRTLKTQQERVRELKRRYDESVRVKGEDDKKTKELAAQYNNATAQMNRTEQQLQRLNEEIRRQSSPWTKLGDHMIETGERLEKFGRGMTNFGKDYSTRVTAPIVAGGAAMFKASMDYESAFAGVRKTVDATEEEFQELSSGIREMTKVLPASATEIAGVAEAAGQLGIETENILSFTRTMIDLGEATNMTAETAATEFARFANIVGMSQKDFDRLGSVVVDLGNNLATTEAEITSMALRLAGAGAQIGLTEAEIMAFAGSLSSVGIAADAGGSAFSKVMVNMQLAAERGGDELKAFADVAGMSASDFKKAFEQDAAGAMISFIEGLSKVAEDGDTAIGVLDEMGITEVRMRDALLRAAGASDVFTESIELGSKAWEENTALTEEAEQRYGTTESQLKIMWNRLKDVSITMGDALVPAVMSAIDAAEPFVKQIESGAKAFSEMDKEQQQTTLKMIALVAAVGPASIVVGQLTTGIGGMLQVGGRLAQMLGAGKGAGLIGRLGLMGATTGPVGLAVGTVGLLSGAIYLLNKATEDNIEETLESIQTRRDELDSLDETIASFEKLQETNKLSTDEVLRYMDIMTELKDAKSEEAIEKLKDEQAELLKKSTLTNEQMDEFLRLNNTIVEETPGITQAISEQGNAYADVLEEVKALSEAERQRLTDDTYEALYEEQKKQAGMLEEQRELQQEINSLENDRKESSAMILEEGQRIRDIDLEIAEVNGEIEAIKRGTKIATQDEQLALLEKLGSLEEERKRTEDVKQTHDNIVKGIDKEIEKKQKSLDETEKNLGLFEELKDEYAQMVLYEQGIVSEKGKAVEELKKQQQEIDKSREKLEKFGDRHGRNTEAYKDQNSELNKQQSSIDIAKRKLEEFNKIAGTKIYRDLDLRINPSIEELNRRLSSPLTRRVNVNVSEFLSGPRALAYATGTDNHPGGRFIAGEEGWELGRLGNRWEVLNAGLYDRPSGYEVFTHNESKRILRALNNMPAYASGTNMGSETNRVVGQLNESDRTVINNENNIVVHAVIRNDDDINKLTNKLDETLSNLGDRRQAAWGG